MTRTAETTSLTTQAFWAVLGTGKPPTVDLVNDWLLSNGHGKRQRNTISSSLKECWGELGKRANVTRTVPGIPEETIALVISLRDQLMDVAKQEFDVDIMEMRRKADFLAAESAAKIASAEAATATARDELQRASHQIDTYIEKLRVSGELTAVLHDQLDASKESFLLLHNERDKLTAQVQEKDYAITAIQAMMRAEQCSHEAAIAAESDRYNAMHRTLLQQIDDGKTAINKLNRQIEKFEERLIEKDKDLQHYLQVGADKHSQLSAELGIAKGMISALEKQIESLMIRVDASQREHFESDNARRKIMDENTLLAQKIAALAEINSAQLQAIVVEAFIAGNSALKSADSEMATIYAAQIINKGVEASTTLAKP